MALGPRVKRVLSPAELTLLLILVEIVILLGALDVATGRSDLDFSSSGEGIVSGMLTGSVARWSGARWITAIVTGAAVYRAWTFARSERRPAETRHRALRSVLTATLLSSLWALAISGWAIVAYAHDRYVSGTDFRCFDRATARLGQVEKAEAAFSPRTAAEFEEEEVVRVVQGGKTWPTDAEIAQKVASVRARRRVEAEERERQQAAKTCRIHVNPVSVDCQLPPGVTLHAPTAPVQRSLPPGVTPYVPDEPAAPAQPAREPGPNYAVRAWYDGVRGLGLPSIDTAGILLAIVFLPLLIVRSISWALRPDKRRPQRTSEGL